MNILHSHCFFSVRTVVALAVFILSLEAGPWHMNSFAHTKDESIYMSGNWVKDEAGWRFFNQWNSSSPAGTWGEHQGNSYYFMDNGYMATGWKYINDHWYYFNPAVGKQEGSMVTGWIHDPDYNGWFYTSEQGIMATGWHKIDGSWYYFNQDQKNVHGLMATSKMIDGSYVDSSGRMAEPR